jgi:hypothetical protein
VREDIFLRKRRFSFAGGIFLRGSSPPSRACNRLVDDRGGEASPPAVVSCESLAPGRWPPS